MGPILPLSDISPEINFFVALLLGIGFGFTLEQAGFSSSRKLAGMFYGYDTTVLKVFFTAAITAVIGLQLLNYFELIDLKMIYVHNTALFAAIIGGIIMGVGFISGGFCPGTSVCAAAIGKIDAIFFIGGIFLGIFIFGETYTLWEPIIKPAADSFMSIEIPLKISDAIGISDSLFIVFLLLMAIGMFWFGEWAEKKFAKPEITKEL